METFLELDRRFAMGRGGEVVRGQVRVFDECCRCGPVRIQWVEVRYVEFFSTEKIVRETAAEPATFTGHSHFHRFEVTVPDGPPTYSGRLFQTGWRLVARSRLEPGECPFFVRAPEGAASVPEPIRLGPLDLEVNPDTVRAGHPLVFRVLFRPTKPLRRPVGIVRLVGTESVPSRSEQIFVRDCPLVLPPELREGEVAALDGWLELPGDLTPGFSAGSCSLSWHLLAEVLGPNGGRWVRRRELAVRPKQPRWRARLASFALA